MNKQKLIVFIILIGLITTFTYGLVNQATSILGNFEFKGKSYRLQGESEALITYVSDEQDLLNVRLDKDDDIIRTITVLYDDVELVMTDAEDKDLAKITYTDSNFSKVIYTTDMTEITEGQEEVYFLFRIKHILNVMRKPTFWRTLSATLSSWALLFIMFYPTAFKFKKFQLKGTGVIVARVIAGIAIVLNLISHYIYILY